jgi:hypothetical protein
MSIYTSKEFTQRVTGTGVAGLVMLNDAMTSHGSDLQFMTIPPALNAPASTPAAGS